MDEKPKTGELIESHQGTALTLPVNPFGDVPGLYASWDVRAREGIDRYAKALRPADLTSDECVDEVLLIEHILCHVVELSDPVSGEVTMAVRTVLIGVGGSTAAFVSKGVWDSLQTVARVYGPPPWKGGRPLRVFRQQTRRKFHVLLLEPVSEGAPNNGQA